MRCVSGVLCCVVCDPSWGGVRHLRSAVGDGGGVLPRQGEAELPLCALPVERWRDVLGETDGEGVERELGVAEAAALIRRGDLTATALLESCLAAIHLHEPKVRAFVDVDTEGARAAAAAADSAKEEEAAEDVVDADFEEVDGEKKD